ncbi:MAG TPA: TetR/AcrR family transcriptional regulator [Ilumatobacteraceae bacterium]
MAQGAAQLLALHGVEGTSFADVLALTNAPRGSIYHHFPGGKTELVHAALQVAGERARAGMEPARGQSPVKVLERFLGLWRGLLDLSHLTAGCAVVAVTVAAGSDELLEHAGTIFRTWTDHLADLLVAGGMKAGDARPFAVMVIAATEGAVALSRAEQSRAPFDTVATALVRQARAFPTRKVV